LFRVDAFRFVAGHVRRFRHLLTLQDDFDVFIVRLRGVKLLVSFCSMTRNTLFIFRGRVELFCGARAAATETTTISVTVTDVAITSDIFCKLFM
jgi:hypothetical protein